MEIGEKIMNNEKKDYTFEELIGIIKMLRSENGCPWDRVQTHQSIKGNLIEEAYEAVEALDSGKKDAFADELGDVLLQVVFHAQIGESEGTFDITDVLNHVCNKMIRRHSHIFGSDSASDSAEVLDLWEKNKQAEKGLNGVSQSMKDVCHYLPSLLRTQKVLKKAVKAGCRCDIGELTDDILKNAEALKIALESQNTEATTETIKTLLSEIVCVAQSADLKAEELLKQATDTFTSRFEKEEQSAKMSDISLSELLSSKTEA